MNKFFCTVVLTLSIVFTGKGQDVVESDDGIEGSVGAGVGLEYGGLGVRLAAPVAKKLEVFAGAGYAVHDMGITGGIAYHPILKGNLRPVVTVMYGANGFVRDVSAELSKIYFGPTIGGGIHYYVGSNDNFFNLKVLYTIYAKDYDDAVKESDGTVLPVLPSLGFHLSIGR